MHIVGETCGTNTRTYMFLGRTHTWNDFHVMTHACLSTSSNSGASTMPCQLLLMALQLVTTSHDQCSSPIGRASVSDTEVSSKVQSHDVAGSHKTKIVSRSSCLLLSRYSMLIETTPSFRELTVQFSSNINIVLYSTPLTIAVLRSSYLGVTSPSSYLHFVVVPL
jgi:hypothetical protein